MHWIALQAHPEACSEATAGPPPVGLFPSGGGLGAARTGGRSEREVAIGLRPVDVPQALGWWALQFTERVARVGPAVVCEVSASDRLFGGRQPLVARMQSPPAELAPIHSAQGASALLALARLQQAQALPLASDAVPPEPDQLPLRTLAAAREHLATLKGLGCRNWGDLRALPRAGIARRFGAGLLEALDKAYGLRPEVYPWLVLPDVFDMPLELPAQVESAPVLMFGANRLLSQLRLWLQARQRGIVAMELSWEMDPRRDTATRGSLPVRTAEATRDMPHLQRLLAEHLAHVRLPAPATWLRLRSLETAPLPGESASLLPETLRTGEGLRQMLERMSARLGPEQVLRAEPHADHRPECMQAWLPSLATDAKGATPTKAARKRGVRMAPLPRVDASLYPTWLLEPPLPLMVQPPDRPLYQGALVMMAGPQRLEAAWWDIATAQASGRGAVRRDYFLARSAQAGLLWIYRERPTVRDQAGNAATVRSTSRWFLQGIFG